MIELRSKTKWYWPLGKWFYCPTPHPSVISWASEPPTPLKFPIHSVVGVWIFSGTTQWLDEHCFLDRYRSDRCHPWPLLLTKARKETSDKVNPFPASLPSSSFVGAAETKETGRGASTHAILCAPTNYTSTLLDYSVKMTTCPDFKCLF